jgi:CTP:molybdopterin cytidylyltransferase MocA
MLCIDMTMKTEDPRIAALIPAAGFSSRMKRLKPLLPLKGKTIIEHVIALFRVICVHNILVVLGHGADQMIPVLRKQDVPYVINPDYSSGMFSSIVKGVENFGCGCDAFFVSPADMPFVRKETLQKMIGAFRETGKAAYRPQYKGRRGHPPLLCADLIPDILAFKGSGGLRAFLAQREDRCVDVPCDDPGILIDLDTPEDFNEYCTLSLPAERRVLRIVDV